MGIMQAMMVGTSGAIPPDPDVTGDLLTWGYNTNGELGVGDNTHRDEPTQVGVLETWQSRVAMSGINSYAIRSDDTMWAWGAGNSGAVGDGASTTRTSPVQIGAGEDWAQVAAYGSSAAAITTDGKLYSWGLNNLGQLGLGDKTTRTSPVQVGSDTDWAGVSFGALFMIAIKTTGEIYSTGYNNVGQLGLGDTTDRDTITQIGSDTDWLGVVASNQSTTTRVMAIKTPA